MAHLKGFAQVMKTLNKEIKAIEGRTLDGLIQAGIIVIRSMEETPPRVPVDFGNLRASRFLVTKLGAEEGHNPEFIGENASRLQSEHSATVSRGVSAAKRVKDPVAIIGFSANYADAVHEAVDKNFRRPGSGAKFLEAAIKRNARAIINVIQEEARIR